MGFRKVSWLLWGKDVQWPSYRQTTREERGSCVLPREEILVVMSRLTWTGRKKGAHRERYWGIREVSGECSLMKKSLRIFPNGKRKMPTPSQGFLPAQTAPGWMRLKMGHLSSLKQCSSFLTDCHLQQQSNWPYRALPYFFHHLYSTLSVNTDKCFFFKSWTRSTESPTVPSI